MYFLNHRSWSGASVLLAALEAIRHPSGHRNRRMKRRCPDYATTLRVWRDAHHRQ
jgi:hypothetical protein